MAQATAKPAWHAAELRRQAAAYSADLDEWLAVLIQIGEIESRDEIAARLRRAG